jgi:hypothetical protein
MGRDRSERRMEELKRRRDSIVQPHPGCNPILCNPEELKRRRGSILQPHPGWESQCLCRRHQNPQALVLGNAGGCWRVQSHSRRSPGVPVHFAACLGGGRNCVGWGSRCAVTATAPLLQRRGLGRVRSMGEGCSAPLRGRLVVHYGRLEVLRNVRGCRRRPPLLSLL